MPGPRGPQGQRGEQGVAGPPGPRNGGVVYTRWGKTSCPNVTGTELVYAGRAGGSWFSHTGGGANYLCMPNDPDYLTYQPGVQGASYVYGTEYQTGGPWVGPLQAVHDHNVPCAVCYASTRVAVTMMPAKTQCPSTWTLEYAGYLMSTRRDYHYRTMFECMLAKTLNSFQGLLQVLMVQCSTMLKPAAQDCLVHLMILRSSGVPKAGPDRAHAQPKAPCFIPLMLRDLVQSACERLAYSRCPANTNDLATPLLRRNSHVQFVPNKQEHFANGVCVHSADSLCFL